MAILDVNGRKVYYTVRREDIRHIYLRIDPDLHLKVILPLKEKISVTRFLKKKFPWIEKKVEEITHVKRLLDGRWILYKGDLLRTRTFRAKKVGKGVRLYRRVLHLYEDSERKREKILREFLTEKTLQVVKRDVRRWVKKLGVTHNRLATKEMRSWGYCSRKGELFFNWRLICLPEELRGYVVLHELLHLKHFDHLRGFKKEMVKYYVNFQEMERRLRGYLPR